MLRSGVRNVKKDNLPKKGKKRSGRRRRAGKITYAQIGNKVYNDVMPAIKLMRRLMNVENKYLDYATTLGVSSTSGNNLINPLAQGTTALTRTGDTVKFDYMYYTFVITINAAATASQVRLCIARDEQPNGALASPGSYMVSSTVTSMTNFQQETRFYTYLDEIVCVDGAGPQTLVYRGAKSLGFHTNYGLGNAGTVADISKNSLFLYAVSNEATNTVSVAVYIRCLFVDN